MVFLLLVGMMGVFAFSGIFDSADVSDDSGEESPDPSLPVDGEFFEVTVDGQTILGSEGDDTVTGSNPTEYRDVNVATGDGEDHISNLSVVDSTVSAGAGDDNLNFRGFNSEVDGGEGNDLIDLDGQNLEIFGGVGDDTILAEGVGSSVIYGGAGNDLITGGGSLPENIFVDGGEGDDILQLDLNSYSQTDAPSMSGGAGADTFDHSLTLENNYGTEFRAGSIEDFVVGEDVLAIEIDMADPKGDGFTTIFDSVELVERSDGTDLRVNTFDYDHDGVLIGKSVAVIGLEGVKDLSVDDIALVLPTTV